jgi:hypothetical protein
VLTDPDDRPEFISDDEAARRYEATVDFVYDALEQATIVRRVEDLPSALVAALTEWYRTTDRYQDNLEAVRERDQ